MFSAMLVMANSNDCGMTQAVAITALKKKDDDTRRYFSIVATLAPTVSNSYSLSGFAIGRNSRAPGQRECTATDERGRDDSEGDVISTCPGATRSSRRCAPTSGA